MLDSLELEFHGCEPSLWELGLGPLLEQQVHLTAEPSVSSSIALDIPSSTSFGASQHQSLTVLKH